MTQLALNSFLPADFNKPTFWVYLSVLVLLFLGGVGFLFWKGRLVVLAVMLAAPILLVIVTQPRLALSQYIFMLFISRNVFESIHISITDISGLILIVAGTLDFLLNQNKSAAMPRLSSNFVFLLLALAFCAVFAFDVNLAFRAVARVGLLFAVFLAACRLIRKTGVEFPLKLFFWLCALHAVGVIIPFIISGGTVRQFGFAVKFFDDLSMLTIPVGIALYLWSEKGEGFKYLVGALVISGALIATQSRAAFIFCALLTTAVFFFSYLRARRDGIAVSSDAGTESKSISSLVTKRVVFTMLAGLASVVLALILLPEIFEAVMFRFTNLFSTMKIGTVLTRFELWGNALRAFADHPIVGLGPGNYKILDAIYPSIRLEFIHFFIRGLTAHNLLLHYLAETGVVGTIAMLAVIINQFRIGRSTWKNVHGLKNTQIAAALYVASIMFVLTTMLEAAWFWGFSGYTFVFFLSMIVANGPRIAEKS